MIPTREETIKTIWGLSEKDYKKVAMYVSKMAENKEIDRAAAKEEVEELTDKFNKKYAQTFLSLAQQ